ncbi:hypothetical protein ACKWTF_006062 [Chironomus riparius]
MKKVKHEVDDLKNKFLNLKQNLLRQPIQIPQMGFSDHTLHNLSLIPESYESSRKNSKIDGDEDNENSTKLSDQELLETTEAIYFTDNVDMELYEIKKLTESGEPLKLDQIEQNMVNLKNQHKVISKKVLQLILEKKSECNREFQNVNETEKMLQETIWTTQKTRSYLNFAKKHLTTSSLEILGAYKKRQTLVDVLEILKFLQELKSTNQNIDELLKVGNYSEAISLLLQNKNLSEKYSEYTCTESFKQKLQDTLDSTEIALDNALNGVTQKFDPKVYSELINAYKLLGKAHLAMDQLHMNFISAIHTSAFNVLKENLDQIAPDQKLLFEQMCESLSYENLPNCLNRLCKSFWQILVCFYQVKLWHQNYKLYKKQEQTTSDVNERDNETFNDDYIHEKLKKGQIRIWSDIQAKMTIFISSTKLSQLKYESFIQILSIVQRMKKVGYEFCDDNSQKMLDAMKNQCIEFFKRYHVTCLDEINLFIEHEVWVQVQCFNSVLQLQEYKSTKRAIKRYSNDKKSENESLATTAVLSVNNSPTKRALDDSSVNSQDESSIYGSCGYFVRFSEKSSPFEIPYDQKMLEEDFLAGIADETSCYYSEDSSDNDNDNITQINNNNNNNNIDSLSSMTVNNTSLNILRIIGRYLQMCRLLYAIAPHIIYSMTELIDFYLYAIYEIFAKDLSVPSEALHSSELTCNLKRISETVISKMRKWPPSMQMIEYDLKDSEQFFALSKRINAVESCNSIIEQFTFIHGYLDHLIESTKATAEEVESEHQSLNIYINEMTKCVEDVRKPIYIAVTTRAIDIHATIMSINKVKWDIGHVMVEHNAYVDVLNRVIYS